jgi:penicillin-insensitive murein DD-endopeptidase
VSRRRFVLVVVLAALVPLATAAATARHGKKKHAHTPAPPSWSSTAVWSAQSTPTAGPPRAIGSYAAGCLRGGVALPAIGPGFEVLHRSRHRFFGHPALVEFVRRLAAQTTAKNLPPLLIGDLAQARGGPTPSDHGSHQTGLDVDVSYIRPPDAAAQPLSEDERERTSFTPVVDVDNRALNAQWNDRIPELLAIAASDPAVDRIFVNPVVKRTMCERSAGAPWLRRLRPWWGHHDHFHVRLRCPSGSPTCHAQPPVPEGDGCDELAWWFDHDALAERHAAQGAHPSPTLPGECRALVR